MPDGSRKRRHSPNAARSRWYALHRATRFRRRFGIDQKAVKATTEVTRTAANLASPAAVSEVLFAGAA